MTQTQIAATYNTLLTNTQPQSENFRIMRIDIQNINAIIERYGRTYRAAALVRRYLSALET